LALAHSLISQNPRSNSSPAMRVILVALFLASVEGGKPELNVDSDTAQKFADLGKKTMDVTAGWKNRTNETALRGQFKNVSFCGARTKVPLKIPEKFKYLWAPKQTEADLLGSPQQRAHKAWAATRGGRGAIALQKKVGLRGLTPGAGSDQTLASGGATGSVAGKEPFATVMKDGFWEVGCYTDKMLTTADKFGNYADEYKDLAGVSIIHYSELIDDADKVAMTPTVCFEFCSSFDDMVFFGITEGRTCYCTPYFSPGPGDGSKCDATCAGDTTLMCGSTTGRSSMFEMHVC